MDHHATRFSCKTLKNKISSVEKLDDNMVNGHVNSVTSSSAALKPIRTIKFKKPENLNAFTSASATSTAHTTHTTHTNLKKIKKLTDTRKNNELPHLEEGKDFLLGFMNSEGYLVCRLCQKKFVSMKYLYHHLRGHSDDDFEAFFAPSDIYNKACDAEVVDQSEIYDEKELNAGKTLVHMANDHGPTAKINMITHKEVGENREDMVVVDENLEEMAVRCLTLLAHGHPSIAESSVHVEELKDTINVKCKVVHDFDLNVAPDMEEDNP